MTHVVWSCTILERENSPLVEEMSICVDDIWFAEFAFYEPHYGGQVDLSGILSIRNRVSGVDAHG